MKDPAFPLYAQDFLMGTMFMEIADVGRYIKLLAFQWDNFNIPKKRLGLLVGLSWENFSPDLKEKFNEDQECIWNLRLEEERERRRQFKEKQALNGQKGGRPKNPKETQKKPKQKPLEEESDNEQEHEVEFYPFNEFWDDYEKKIGDKDKLESKWNRIGIEDRKKIKEYIPLYIASQPEKKYRKNPDTFLNNKSWNDEIIESDNNPKQTGKQSNIANLAELAKQRAFSKV